MEGGSLKTVHVGRQEEDAPTSETTVLWLLSNTHLLSQEANWVALEVSSQSSLLHLSWLLLQSTPNLSQRLNDPDCSERGTVTCRTSRSVQPHSSWRRSDSGVQHQWSGVCPKKTTPTSTKAKSINGNEHSVTTFFWKGPKSPTSSMSLSTFAISSGYLVSCIRCCVCQNSPVWGCLRGGVSLKTGEGDRCPPSFLVLEFTGHLFQEFCKLWLIGLYARLQGPPHHPFLEEGTIFVQASSMKIINTLATWLACWTACSFS